MSQVPAPFFDESQFLFPPKPAKLDKQQQAEYKDRIKALLKEKDAVLVAHYYTDPEIQALAEETGGCVADSLEMARTKSRNIKSPDYLGVKLLSTVRG